MPVQVISFGPIAEILGSKFLVYEASDTDELQRLLFENYPELKTRMFAIAVDREVVSDKTSLSENSEVALLPPFSGG